MHFYGGNLFADERQFMAMMEQIRRQGHFYQSEGLAKMMGGGGTESHPKHHGRPFLTGQAGQPAGRGHFTVMPMIDSVYSHDPWATPALGAGLTASPESAYPTCGTGSSGHNDPWLGYLGGGDDGSSSGTDDDEKVQEEELNAYVATLGVPDTLVADVLFQEYIMARKRWRSYTGKTPRVARRNLRHGKGGFPASRRLDQYGKGQYITHGKGAGKGRRDPTGRDGQIMKCHSCQSEHHLIKDCPQNTTAPNKPLFLANSVMTLPGMETPTVQGTGVLAGISAPASSTGAAGSAYNSYAFT